ncbi:response regulator [bacterium]|nr:response regulator [candidate division CSSED10-310 bacterium]
MVEKRTSKAMENRINVLIADDDVDILRLLRMSLLREGYRVTTARDGAQALDKIQSDRPDVLILDVMMPNLGGLDLLEKLKSQKNTEKLPVILLTKKKSYKDIKTGYSFGADFYITKPFKISQVIEGIKIVTKSEGLT